MKKHTKIGLLALLLVLACALALLPAVSRGSGDADVVDVIVVHDWLSQLADREPTSAKVQVQLLRDGDPYGDPVMLDAAHDWEYYWRDLDGGHEWTVDRVGALPASYTLQPDAAYGEYVRESDGTRHKYVVCSMIAADNTCRGARPWDCPVSVHETWFCDPESRPAHVTLALDFDGGDGNPLDAVSLGELNGWRYLISCSGVYDRRFGEHLTDGEWRDLVAERLKDKGVVVESQETDEGDADEAYGRPDEGYQIVVEHFWEQRDTGSVQSACVIANVPA